jgi:hypothetical protein
VGSPSLSKKDWRKETGDDPISIRTIVVSQPFPLSSRVKLLICEESELAAEPVSRFRTSAWHGTRAAAVSNVTVNNRLMEVFIPWAPWSRMRPQISVTVSETEPKYCNGQITGQNRTAGLGTSPPWCLWNASPEREPTQLEKAISSRSGFVN